MDRQRQNRLKYLRQNRQYLSNRELQELERLEVAASSTTEAEPNNYRKINPHGQFAADREEFPADSFQGQRAQNRVSTNNAKKVKKNKKPKKRLTFGRFMKRLAIVLGLLLVAAIVAAFMIFSDVQNILKKTYVPTTSAAAIHPTKPLTLLLMGVDTGDATRGGSGSWNGNSDSQIVMTLNPSTQTMTMVSMERDTMTPILDNNGNVVSTQKMNAAYPAGYNAGGLAMGAQYAMSTIGTQAGIPINNFVVINMDGLVNLVNDVGGIDVVNDSGSTITIANTEPEYTATVPYISGNPPQHINGDQALVFSRDRDTLPNGDYGRAAHQREVLTAVFKKLLTVNSVLNYHRILTDISGDFKTNIKMNTSGLLSLMAYRGSFNKTVSIQYQGVDATAAGSDGVYASYQLMPANVDLAVQNILRQSIGQATSNQLSQNVVSYENYFSQDASGYYMPSATITQKGQTPTVKGIDTNGNLVPITSDNAGDYVSTTGSAAGN